MKESLIMSAEFVLENLLMYLIFLVGSFTTAKFFKDEDRYYNNRKKFIVLSGVIYILVSFIKVSLNIRYIIFALINGLLFNQLFEEKINRLVISNLFFNDLCFSLGLDSGAKYSQLSITNNTPINGLKSLLPLL